MKLTITFLLIAVSSEVVRSAPSSANPLVSYDVIFGWKQLDFEFPTPERRAELIESKKFIPENNVIAGIKVHGENVYLTVPRWKAGVPATLVRLPYKLNAAIEVPKGVKNGPKLIPYPSWELNELGNCRAFQYVQSMEIDQYGRMWVIDTGRVNTMEEGGSDSLCPPKLVLLNVTNDEILFTYEFPESVVDRDTNFLNDIVVGCTSEEDCWAYITDSGDAKIVVYNLAMNSSWFVEHSSMRADPEASEIETSGQKYKFNSSVNGIALSPLDTGFDTLFYNPLSSYNLYSVPTEVLKKAGESNSENGTELADDLVKTVGSKSSQSAGMIIDAGGLLYYGLLAENAVNSWNTTYSSFTSKNQALLVQSDIDLQYPDTFSIDTNGYVFVTTNRLGQFLTKTYDFKTTNFRVVRFYVGLKSYMYPKNDTVEPNPELVASEVAAEPEPEAEAEPESEPTAEPAAAEPEAEPTSEPEPEKSAEGKEPQSEPESEPEPEGTPSKEVPISPDDKHLYHHDDHSDGDDHHHEVESNDIGEQRSLSGAAGSLQFSLHFLAISLIALVLS